MFMLSPGVYTLEKDLTEQIQVIATSVGGIAFASKRGSLSTTLNTSAAQFTSRYGAPDPTIGFGHDSALAFLAQSRNLHAKRVVSSDAQYAGVSIVLEDGQRNYIPFLAEKTDFNGGAPETFSLKFSRDIISGDSITLHFNETITATYAFDNPVTFPASNQSRLQRIVDAISAAFTNANTRPICTIVQQPTGVHRIIRIVAKTNTELTVDSVSVTSGNVNNPLTITIERNNKIMDVFAENPGVWGNSLGIKINNINNGDPDRWRIQVADVLSDDYSFFGTVNTKIVGDKRIWTLAFGGALTSSHSLTIKVNGVVLSTVNWNTDHNTTVSALAAAIVTKLNQLYQAAVDAKYPDLDENDVLREGLAYYWLTNSSNTLVANGTSGSAVRYVYISAGGYKGEVGSDFALSEPVVSGASPPTFTTGEYTLTTQASVDFAKLPDVSTTVDEDEQNNLIFQYLARAFNATYNNTNCGLVPMEDGESAYKEMLYIGPDAESDYTPSGHFELTSSGTQDIAVGFTKTLDRIPSPNTFNIDVYESNDVTISVESFTVSLKTQTDGFGRQQNVVEVINNSAIRSERIRVWVPSYVPANVPAYHPNGADALIRWFGGGDDGSLISAASIKAGWTSAFESREQVDVRILIGGGYATPTVHQHIVSLAGTRRDCVAVIDAPSDRQRTSDALAYRREELNVNSSYGALYTPDLLVADSSSNVKRYIPPSGYIAGTYAYTDDVAEPWFSPAGLNRGLLSNILGLAAEYSMGDRDVLNPNQINPIIKKPGYGYPVWGDRTLYAKNSVLQSINVRRLLIVIEVAIANTIATTLFEQNDAQTRFNLVQPIEQYLRSIRNRRGLTEYQVVCDSTNNSPQDEANLQLNLDIYLKPTLSVQFLKLQAILTPNTVQFSELISIANG